MDEFICERCRATRVVTDIDEKIVNRALGRDEHHLNVYVLVAYAQCRGCGKHLYWDGKKYNEEAWF